MHMQCICVILVCYVWMTISALIKMAVWLCKTKKGHIVVVVVHCECHKQHHIAL